MPNTVKQSGEGPALQVTKPARAAELAELATGEGKTGVERWADLADVRVYGFDKALLVVRPSEMKSEHIAELVASAARDTGSIYNGMDASVRAAGNGCMVSLPGLDKTGIHVDDTAPVHPGPDILVVTDGSADRARLAKDLVSIRQAQIGE